MAGSSYYYSQYLMHLAEADKYKNWKEDLEEMQNMLRNDYDNNVYDVNNELRQLNSGLLEAILKDTVYNANIGELEQKKEREAESDQFLGGAISSLQAEIGRLQQLYYQEKQDAQDCYESYLSALREEEEALRRASASNS